MRVRLALVVALVAASPAVAQAPDGSSGRASRMGTWRDTTYVDAVIRLDVERGPSEVLPALTYNSTLMLPLRQFAELVELKLTAFALRDSATLMLEPGHIEVTFRPAARSLTRSNVRVAYDTLDITWWEGELFVATRVLDQLLGVTTVVDWPSLSARVARAQGLPVVMRMRREQRRQMIGQRRPAPDVLDIALRPRVIDGAVGSWFLTAARRGPTDQISLDLGLGMELLGGSAELRPLFFASDDVADAELRFSWSKAWAESRTLRQLHIGDVQSSGRHSRFIQGVVATNAPFIRSSEFDVENLVTNVPPGWEAELYGNGRLVAFAEADAAGAFRVPLQLGYGQNPYEVVLYGPGGETVRQTRTIRVPFSRIPTGRVEYSVASGLCRYDPCDGLFSADVRYGLSSRVTLQGGWDAVIGGANGTLWQPYAVVSGAPLPSLALTGEAVINGLARGTVNFEPTIDLRATASHTRFAASGARLTNTSAEASRSEGSVFWNSGLMRGTLIFQGTGFVSNGPLQRRNFERLSATARFGQFRYGVGLLRDEVSRAGAADDGRFAIDLSADAALMGPWRWLRYSAVQGQLAIEPSRGLSAMRGGFGRNIARGLRVDAGLGWLRGSGVSLDLALTTATRGPRFGARSRVTSQAGSEALVYASGSVAYDPRTRLTRLSDVSALGRAGISGVLFQDDNNNGRQDPGEAGIPGIPVRVGGWPAETDAHGRFAAWGMFPSEPLQIDFDTLSFGNPQLVLPAPLLRVRPSPNSFGVIAVPVVVGAEVSGYVTLGDAPLAGVEVVLHELNTGAEIRTVTFQDGGFYRGAVPPGEYEVVLPEALLTRLRADAIPLSIFVPPGAGERRFTELRLRLESRQ